MEVTFSSMLFFAAIVFLFVGLAMLGLNPAVWLLGKLLFIIGFLAFALHK